MFERQHYGKPISKGLSVYLRKYTTDKDMREVAVEFGYTFFSVRNLRFRQTGLTKDNSVLMVELMRRAIDNYKQFKDDTKDIIMKENVDAELKQEFVNA